MIFARVPDAPPPSLLSIASQIVETALVLTFCSACTVALCGLVVVISVAAGGQP